MAEIAHREARELLQALRVSKVKEERKKLGLAYNKTKDAGYHWYCESCDSVATEHCNNCGDWFCCGKRRHRTDCPVCKNNEPY
jgi:primosomal protein N'